MPEKHVHLSIFGADAAEVLAQTRAFGGGVPLQSFSTDDLLAELRDRLCRQSPPMVVRVLPFSDDDKPGDEQPAEAEKTETTRRGRPPKAKTPVDPKPEPETPADAKTEAPREEPKAIEPEAMKEAAPETLAQARDQQANEWNDDAAGSETKALTIDDVKLALNAYSAVHGQVKTREIMKDKGGALRLIDIPADKYAALIAALAVDDQKQAA